MRTETIKLGEREYQLTELPLRKASAYRERISEHFGDAVNVFERVPDTDISSPREIAGMIRGLSDTLLKSVDLVADMLFEYSTELQKDREYIEDNAYGSEVVDAFMAVLRLTFPFFGERGAKLAQAMGMIGSNKERT